MSVKEEFLNASIRLLHDWQKDPEQKTFQFYERFEELYSIMGKSDFLRKMIALEDIRDAIGWVCTHLGKSLETI